MLLEDTAIKFKSQYKNLIVPFNENRFPIWIKRGMKIGQICFFKMNGRARHPYGSEGLGSHYNNQNGPTPARS